MAGDGHHYADCADRHCDRFPCRVYKEGAEHGYDVGRQVGQAEGYAEGYGDGYPEVFAAGAASASRSG